MGKYYYDLYSDSSRISLGSLRDYLVVGDTFIDDGKLFIILEIDLVDGYFIIEEVDNGAN